MVPFIEIVVDLGHTVVAITGGGSRTEEVVRGRRQIINERRPKNGRSVGVGIAKQCLRKRTRRNSVGSQQSQSLGLPGKRRFGSQSGEADDVPLFFKTDKKESPVFENGAADAESGVVVAQWRGFGGDRAGLEEGRRRAVKFIPIVVVSASVQAVGTGFEHQVYGAAGIAPGLGARLGLR